MTVLPRNYPTLPEHPEPGEYQCPECGARVTVGESGTEYGHASDSTSGSAERCPRRPGPKVDPRRSNQGGAV